MHLQRKQENLIFLENSARIFNSIIQITLVAATFVDFKNTLKSTHCR